MKPRKRIVVLSLCLLAAALFAGGGSNFARDVLSLAKNLLGAESYDARAVESDEFQIVAVGGGLNHPWGMAFLPDGRALITERGGGLKMLVGDKLINIAHELDIAAAGQGGLLDVAVAPDFDDGREVYFSLSAKINGGDGTKIVRAKLQGARMVDAREIFRMAKGGKGGRHFGSRLLFADGALFASIGDRGARDLAQDIDRHNGSIIRITRDGAAASDNPFVGKSGARPEIYSYGHRNPQGLARHPRSGAIWSSEFGPQGGDEINIIEAGKNYGWPIVTYGKEYGTGFDIGLGTHSAGMTPPIVQWTPSISPSGIAFYDGDQFPHWRGDLFVAALSGRHLRRLEIDGEKVAAQQVLLQGIGRVRHVVSGPEGYLWLLLDARDAPLLKLVPPSWSRGESNP